MTLEERATWLQALVDSIAKEEFAGPILARPAGLFCNGCGLFVSAPSWQDLVVVAEKWHIADDLGGDDFCPACVRHGGGVKSAAQTDHS